MWMSPVGVTVFHPVITSYWKYIIDDNEIEVWLAMSDQHVHDEEETRKLEAVYTSSAAVERRQFVRDRLDVQPGEVVLSIGCGPGFEPAELAQTVTERGRVYGIDVSEDMLAMADQRCADLAHVTLERGDATDLSFADDRFDAAVSVQVYEYLNDLDTAVAELHRVLRPGGRVAVYSTDFDSLVWHSSDRTRMERAINAWTTVYANPHLGSQLTSYFHDAGFAIEHVEPNSILNTDLDGTFAGFLIDLFQGQMEAADAFDSTDIETWERDLKDLDEAGETFFNLIQYLYIVRKPA